MSADPEAAADHGLAAEGGDATDGTTPALPDVGVLAGLHVLVAALFAVAGLVGLVVAYLQLVWPELGSGVASFSYGRLRPMAGNALFVGFGVFGMVGAAYAVLNRVGRRPLAARPVAAVALAIGLGGLVAGIVAVGMGHSRGTPLFELPLWAAAAVAVSLLTAAAVVVATARAAPASAAPAVWYSVAGVVVMAFAYAVGTIPGISGINGALQAAFSLQALLGVGMVAVAIGAGYAVAGEWMERGQQGTRLSQIGFWSFLFIAPWVAPRLLALGPIPDWLETIAVVFGLVLLIPVIAVLADLAAVMRTPAVGTVPYRFLVTGAGFVLLYAIISLVQGLRSPSAVVQFTAWSDAFPLAVVLGIAGSALAALRYRLFPAVGGARRRRRVHWWLACGGLVVALAAVLGSGLQQGLAFVSGAGAEDPIAFGEGFRAASEPLAGWHVVVAVGLAAVMAGIGLFAAQARRLRPPVAAAGGVVGTADEENVTPGPEEAATVSEPADSLGDEPAPPLAPGRLVLGAVGLFVLAALSVFVLPSLESANNTATLRGEERRFATGSLEAEGRDLYVSEGCVYCHTQQVRPIVTDVGLGPVSQPGDYEGDSPALLGQWRIGPDLFAAGDRAPTDSVRFVVDHLRDPRQAFDGGPGRPWSAMPSYDYMRDEQLLQLASYIVALK